MFVLWTMSLFINQICSTSCCWFLRNRNCIVSKWQYTRITYGWSAQVKNFKFPHLQSVLHQNNSLSSICGIIFIETICFCSEQHSLAQLFYVQTRKYIGNSKPIYSFISKPCWSYLINRRQFSGINHIGKSVKHVPKLRMPTRAPVRLNYSRAEQVFVKQLATKLKEPRRPGLLVKPLFFMIGVSINVQTRSCVPR